MAPAKREDAAKQTPQHHPILLRARIAPRLILVLLLAGQAALALRFGGIGKPAFGDEPYYIGKALYFAEHHRFERGSRSEIDVERGREWGQSDWRPQGYPLFVALCAAGDFRVESVRFRVAVAQFLILAVVLFVGFMAIDPHLSAPFRYVAALLFGISPWPFEFVTIIVPDSLNAALTLAGALILWRGRTPVRVFGGSLLLMSTMLLRPEMAVLAPLVIAVAVALQGRDRWRPRAAAAALAVALVVGSQLGYRRVFTGEWTVSVFGGLHIRDQGAFDWVNTWFGTEGEAYDFVYGLTNGNLHTRLPDRAFADESERRRIESAIESVRRTGQLSRAADEAFAEVAAKRAREHPMSAVVGPRIWHAVHLWVNLETNSQLLNALAGIPAVIRRGILALLLALKGCIYGLFIAAVVRSRRFLPELRQLVLILATVVVLRTLLIGVVLNWMVHRYVLTCWPSLLVCAAAAMSTAGREQVRRILG